MFDDLKKILTDETDAVSRAEQARRVLARKADEAYETLVRKHFQGEFRYETGCDDAAEFTIPAEAAIEEMARAFAQLWELVRETSNRAEPTQKAAAYFGDIFEAAFTSPGQWEQDDYAFGGWMGALFEYHVSGEVLKQERERAKLAAELRAAQ